MDLFWITLSWIFFLAALTGIAMLFIFAALLANEEKEEAPTV